MHLVVHGEACLKQSNTCVQGKERKQRIQQPNRAKQASMLAILGQPGIIPGFSLELTLKGVFFSFSFLAIVGKLPHRHKL